MFILHSCQKDPATSNNERLFTHGMLKLVKPEDKRSTFPRVNVFPFLDACEQDDEWVFMEKLCRELRRAAIKFGQLESAVQYHGRW